MNQTKLESWIEVFFNYLTGFLIAYTVYAMLVIPTAWLKESPFWVTTLFTLVSVIRSYLWRRFFNAGLHSVVHRLVKTTPNAVREFTRKTTCRIRGHQYPGCSFDPYHLYFCQRCGKEQFDRSFEDIDPTPEDWGFAIDDYHE